MSLSNLIKIIVISFKNITNINKILKIIKSDIITDFICADNCGLIIITNNVVFPSYLLYAKSTCLENISLWYIPYQQTKSTFYSGYLTHNTSNSSDAIIWVFHLSWQKYSYSTWSSMTELLLSVSQYWKPPLEIIEALLLKPQASPIVETCI